MVSRLFTELKRFKIARAGATDSFYEGAKPHRIFSISFKNIMRGFMFIDSCNPLPCVYWISVD